MPERRRRDDLPARPRAQHRLGVLRQRDPVRDRRPERVEPEHLHAQPQLQRAGASRELDPAVAEVDLAAERVAQVLAAQRERALQQPRLAHQHRARLVGLEEPLVRVDHQRVRSLDARERRAARVRQAPPPPRRRRRRGTTAPPPRTATASSPSGSIAPVFVVPAFATTANGVRPAARSAAIGGSHGSDRQPEPRIRPQHPHLALPHHLQVPQDRAVRLVATCTRRRPPPRASRAATSAVNDAIEPPLVSSPSVPAGIPHHDAQPVQAP